MKKQTKFQLLIAVIVVLTMAVVYFANRTEKVFVVSRRPRLVQHPPPRMEREFRQPPVRSWKPGHFHQMGLLTNEAGETLPLYGKEVRGRRDRYNFYTTTGGDNLYSIPIKDSQNRDCMDDVGCRELYGSESVDVAGKPFNVNMYRVDNFM